MLTNTQLPLSYLSFNNFRRPFVRDLAFALACPTVLNHWQDDWQQDEQIAIQRPSHPNTNTHTNTLIPNHIHIYSDQFWQQQYLTYQDRLIELDTTTDYQLLTKFLINRPSPHRLGFHFEGLMLFWLLDGLQHRSHSYEVIAHNVQIFDGDKTLGELDLIIKNHETGDIEHWELAIKFFLGSPPFYRENWVGINSRDNLQRKVDHMANKPFSQTFVTVDKKRYDIDKRFAVIKGRFFKPVTSEFTYPNWLNPNFPLHTWVTAEQAKLYFRTHSCHTQALRKANYIEWFTHRPFLDKPLLNRPLLNEQTVNLKSANRKADTVKEQKGINSFIEINEVDQLDSLATGLYMFSSSKSNINNYSIEPLVIL